MAKEAGIDTMILNWRRRVQRFSAGALAPLINWLTTRGVRPDQVTWMGFYLAAAAGVLAAFHLFILAGILLLLSGAADLVDGALARRSERVSDAGAFLDSVLDRGGEAILHAGVGVAFAWWGFWPGVLAVFLSLGGSHLTSYARARAEGLGVELEEVWVGRGERVLLLGLGLVFHIALIMFWVVAIASWAAAVHRVWLAHQRLAATPADGQDVGGEPGEEDDAGKDDDA